MGMSNARRRGAAATQWIVLVAIVHGAALGFAFFDAAVVRKVGCFASRVVALGGPGSACAATTDIPSAAGASARPSPEGEVVCVRGGACSDHGVPRTATPHEPLQPACFVAGTPVATPDGARAIDSLRVGDVVLAEEPTTGEIAPKRVLATKRTDARPVVHVTVTTTGGRETITMTPNHPVWLRDRGWAEAETLVLGDRIASRDSDAIVERLEASTQSADVFNLEVADVHTYLVGASQLLVHNDCDPPVVIITEPRVLFVTERSHQAIEHLRRTLTDLSDLRKFGKDGLGGPARAVPLRGKHKDATPEDIGDRYRDIGDAQQHLADQLKRVPPDRPFEREEVVRRTLEMPPVGTCNISSAARAALDAAYNRDLAKYREDLKRLKPLPGADPPPYQIDVGTPGTRPPRIDPFFVVPPSDGVGMLDGKLVYLRPPVHPGVALDESYRGLMAEALAAALGTKDEAFRRMVYERAQACRFHPEETASRELHRIMEEPDAPNGVKRLAELLKATAALDDPRRRHCTDVKQLRTLLKNQLEDADVKRTIRIALDRIRTSGALERHLKYLRSPAFYRRLELGGTEQATRTIREEVASVAMVDPAAAKQISNEIVQHLGLKRVDEMTEDEIAALITRAAEEDPETFEQIGSDHGLTWHKGTKMPGDVAKKFAKVFKEAAKRAALAAGERGAESVEPLRAGRMNKFVTGLETFGGLTTATAALGWYSVASDAVEGNLFKDGKVGKPDYKALATAMKTGDATEGLAKLYHGFRGTKLSEAGKFAKAAKTLKILGPLADGVGAVLDGMSAYENFERGHNTEGFFDAVASAAQVAAVGGAIAGQPHVVAAATVIYVVATVGKEILTTPPDVEMLEKIGVYVQCAKDFPQLGVHGRDVPEGNGGGVAITEVGEGFGGEFNLRVGDRVTHISTATGGLKPVKTADGLAQRLSEVSQVDRTTKTGRDVKYDDPNTKIIVQRDDKTVVLTRNKGIRSKK